MSASRDQRAIGWIVLGVALVGADMALGSLGVATVAVLIGFALRPGR